MPIASAQKSLNTTRATAAKIDEPTQEKKKIGATHRAAPILIYRDCCLDQTVGAQEDEYAVAEEQAHCTYDETYLDHILLPNETSTISNVLMKKTNKATAMLSPTTARIVTRSCVAESEINLP